MSSDLVYPGAKGATGPPGITGPGSHIPGYGATGPSTERTHVEVHSSTDWAITQLEAHVRMLQLKIDLLQKNLYVVAVFAGFGASAAIVLVVLILTGVIKV